MLERLAAALRSAVTRGRVTDSQVGPRTLLQVTGLDNVTMQTIELLLPPGYSARPAQGADVLLMQVMAQGDHVVALGGDTAGAAIQDLNPGEFGLTDGTQMVVFRTDHVQIVSPTRVRVESPRLECTGEIVAHCDSGSVGMTTHTHIASGAGGNTQKPNANT